MVLRLLWAHWALSHVTLSYLDPALWGSLGDTLIAAAQGHV